MTDAPNAEIDATPARRFAPYSAYKDFGVEWLRKIPAHWEVKPLKHLTAFATGWTPPTGREDLYGGEHLWANIGDLGAKILSTTEKTISNAAIREARLPIVRAGSLLFSFKLSVGAVSIAGVDMFTNEAIAAFAPSQRIDIRYLYWSAPVLVPRNAQENIYGAPLLSRERIANAYLLSPPMPEQHGIAAFLDRETAKIEELIAQEERLIELLQEQRAALITRAVTKGLAPSVSTKHSGVEWLGEVPANWEVKALKRLASLRAGSGITAESIEQVGDYPVFGGNGMRGFTSSYTHDGDFPLIGRQGALCGCVNFASGKFWASEHAVVAVPETDLDPYWLAYLLHAMSLNSYSESAAQPGLAIDTISVIPVPCPGLPEQRAIAAFLDRETARIDALVAKVLSAIDRLRELRTALISAAVTGMIDVRDEVT